MWTPAAAVEGLIALDGLGSQTVEPAIESVSSPQGPRPGGNAMSTKKSQADPDLEDEYDIRGWRPSPIAGRYHEHLCSQRPGGGSTPPDKPYTLFRGRGGRLIGDYATQADALDAVLPEVRANGDADDLVLMHVTTRRGSLWVAAGGELLVLARRAVASKRAAS